MDARDVRLEGWRLSTMVLHPLLHALWLFLLGILGASTLIIRRRPDSATAISKIEPYQGWIGVVATVLGAWTTLAALFGIGAFPYAPIRWVLWLADGAVTLALGLLLGVGIFQSFLGSLSAKEKFGEVVGRLKPYRQTLGVVAIGLGLWTLITAF